MPGPGAPNYWKGEVEVLPGVEAAILPMVSSPPCGSPKGSCGLEATSLKYHRTPWELLVATILSAQSTDKLVNSVTPALFRRYPTALDYAQADRAELEEMIHSTGFFRNKANSLIGMGQAVVEKHDGVGISAIHKKTLMPLLQAIMARLWAEKQPSVIEDPEELLVD